MAVKLAERKGEGNQKGIKKFPIWFHCKGFLYSVSNYLVEINMFFTVSLYNIYNHKITESGGGCKHL